MDNNTHTEKYTSILKPWLEWTGEMKSADTGRPRIIKNPKIMAIKTLEYILNTLSNGNYITLLGLILHLGLSSYATFNLYNDYDPEFKKLIETIKTIVEESYVNMLNVNQFGAARFVLSSSYGYTETSRQIIEGDRVVNISIAGVTDKSKEEREKLNKKYNE